MNRFVSFEDVDLTIEQHHAHSAYGSTKLKALLSDARPSANAADRGNAVHLLAMFPEQSDRVIVRKTFAGTGAVAARKAWIEEHKGFYHFPPAEYRDVLGMAKALRDCPPLRGFLVHPEAQLEHTVLATTDTGIVVKARTDIRGPGKMGSRHCRIIVDVKTTGEDDDEGFARSVGKYGYDLQSGLYGDVEAQKWDLPVLYYLYAVQSAWPHRVLRMKVSDEWRHTGRMLYEAAIIKAEIKAVTDIRLPLHWEGDRLLPPPTPWHTAKAERILDHARTLRDRFESSRRDT